MSENGKGNAEDIIEFDTKKSYFYVLSEETDCSEPDKELLEAFRRFQKAHEGDSKVVFLTPKDENFGKARNLFNINQTPAFVIADEPHKLESGTNPFISLNRPAFDKLTDGKMFNLITDIHYLLIDENILRVKRRLTLTWLHNLFRDTWSELKDFVNISI